MFSLSHLPLFQEQCWVQFSDMEEDNEYGGGPEAMEPEPEPEQQPQHEQGPGGGGGETCANFYACFYMILF